MERRRRILFPVAALFISGCVVALCVWGRGPNPVSDAKRAAAAGDRRLVGYMGVGLVVPGTPPGFQHWTYSPGVKVVSHVSDTSSPREIQKADDYAARYNQVILGATGGAP
jgi:hypothetical protein